MGIFESHDAGASMRLLIAWAGAALGALTLQHVVLLLTAIYTAIQTYVLLRDKVFNRE
jgi:hypothetical protein